MESNPIRIRNTSNEIQVHRYPSADLPQRAAGVHRGAELFDYLYQPDSPNPLLPPSFGTVVIGGNKEVAPIGDTKIVKGLLVPSDEYLASRTKLSNEFPDKGIEIFQRGYGITKATSVRPIIATNSIAPCIAVIAYRSDTQTAALAHVDAEQDFASLEAMLDLPEFQGVVNIELHFYGGMAGFEPSRDTCCGLLNAVIDINQRRPNFIIQSFDVMARPHVSSLCFDTRTGKKFAFPPHFMAGFRGFLLDTCFRLWPDGNYLAVQDGVDMKNAMDNPPNHVALTAPNRAYLDTIRLQWSGASGLAGFKATANPQICQLIVQKASTPHVAAGVDNTFTAAVASALAAKNVPIAFEQSLKDWAIYHDAAAPNPINAAKATDSIVAVIQTVLQANVTLAQRSHNLHTALDTWVQTHPHPYEGKY